jgi:hypothetical protein
MLLRETIAVDGHMFLKSEWGPISDDWPALSFTKRSVGDRLRREFDPARDIILYVGTSNPESTGNPLHRQRLLSAVKAEPNAIVETRLLVPVENWERSQREYGKRWEWSLPVRQAWDIVGLPLAASVIPESYSHLGKLENLGNVVEVAKEERSKLLDLEVTPIELSLGAAATSFDDKRGVLSLSTAIRKEIGRIAAGLIERARRGGTESVRVAPLRLVDSDIQILLGKKWQEQRGCCALCDGSLVIGGPNKLLQASADRINGKLATYDAKNMHITHLGCNLAKSDVSMLEFEEWLAVLREGIGGASCE